MNRRQIRYLISRLRTAETGGVEAPDLPDGFVETFERQDKFRGWSNYQKIWDVDDSGWNIVLLDISAEEEWNKLLEEKVPELPEELSGSKSNIRSYH